MDRKKFFDTIRGPLFQGAMSLRQVGGMTAMLNQFEAKHIPQDQQAYMLATAFHETAGHMQPVIETRRRDEASNPPVDVAISRLENTWKAGRLPWVKTPYWRKDAQGKSWLGRGLPQLTHKVNYDKVGRLIGVDLLTNPDRALDTNVAVDIMIAGMTLGIFTGRRMSDFLDGVNESDAEDYREFVAARPVVNGKDKAEIIAGHSMIFDKALS